MLHLSLVFSGLFVFIPVLPFFYLLLSA